MELSFQDILFLRAGLEDKKPTLGGGLKLRYFELDYATGRFGDPEFFQRNHRFSLVLFLGKSLPEQRRVMEQRRQREMQRKVDQEMEGARRKRIDDGLKAGKNFLAAADYFNARLEFGRVLKEEPDNGEARSLLDETTRQEQAVQQEREQNLLRETRMDEAKQKDLAYVNQNFQEGVSLLDKGQYQNAIEKWNQALERDPSNTQVQTYVQKANEILDAEIQRRIGHARQLVRQENLAEAYRVLREARDMVADKSRWAVEIAAEMKNLDTKFGFLNAAEAGMQRFENQEYAAAAQFFQKAVELEPGNAKVQELFRIAQARAQGPTKEMNRPVKEKYTLGLRYYQEGNYEAAIRVWEEALQSDPNNVKLLEALRGARLRVESFKKNK
jgi:tetratricopeptide (TPR) repeat protein